MLIALLLVSSLCIDSFVASIAYGASGIKIPIKSALIINTISTLTLAVSLLIGSVIKNFLPDGLPQALGFIILFFLGVYRLFEFFFKRYIKKRSTAVCPLKFKAFDFNFVLQVYADETIADFDKSNSLSPKEAVYLALALSLDSLAVGFGSSMGGINFTLTLVLCFAMGVALVSLGEFLGRKCSERFHVELSWLSGVLLIILAFIRTF